jgi:hypothetical protein
MKYIALSIIIILSLNNNLLSQTPKLTETIDYINVKLKGFSDEYSSEFIWQIKHLKYGVIEQNDGRQTLIYNLNDINRIKYIFEDGKHIVRLYCTGNINCIRNGLDDNWDYLSILVISKKEAESIIKAFNYLKSIIPKDPFR